MSGYEIGFNEGLQKGVAILRDQFAMAALTGMLATPSPYSGATRVEEVAEGAYKYADAMLQERDKK